jgi:hypothetical protein
LLRNGKIAMLHIFLRGFEVSHLDHNDFHLSK